MDPFETSSFSSLIEREEREEVIQLDLHTAALIGDYDMVRDCIHTKSDLDHTNRGGWTPLMYAAYVGRDNILNMLLDAGARIDIQSKGVKLGSTALMLASYCATESIMYFLLQHGASINLRDGEGMTSLFHAVRQGHQSAVKLLASKGADLDLGQYLTGITPIMEAAISGHELIFNILLDHGADITRRTKKGETVKSLAMRHKNTSIVALIDKHISPQEPTRKEPTLELHDQFGASISSSGVIEGSIQDGPAIIDSLMRNAANSARNPDFSEGAPVASLCPEIQNKLSIQGQGGPRPQINNPAFQNEPPNQKRAQGILKPPIDVFNQNSPISALPPKLPDTLGELLAEYNLQMYLSKLEGEGLDVATFLELCDNDLKELGIDKFGPRKKMLLAIRECKERMAVHDPNIDQVQVDQYQVRIRDLTMHLQQALAYCKNYQTQLYQEQQYRQEFGNYLEAEAQRMKQIFFYSNNIGKNCKEASAQLRKMKEYINQFSMFLQKFKDHPNFLNLSNELHIDTSVFEAVKNLQCEVEMAGNRLDMTFKQVERTLMIAQLEIPNNQQQLQQQPQQQQTANPQQQHQHQQQAHPQHHTQQNPQQHHTQQNPQQHPQHFTSISIL